jgi:FAD/FMN-containing dehydrogenase
MHSERVRDLDAYLAALTVAAGEWLMTMGWIDCVNGGSALGRGILMAGRWATAEEARATPPRPAAEITLPFTLPNFAVNTLTCGAFNRLYYRKHVRRQMQRLVGPDPFFYPLDAIHHWNRGYGSRGFTQHQCVMPRAAGPEAVRELMKLLTRLGCASPLCVIKDCGPEGKGLLSFPLEGTSIAVDIAVSPDIQRIVDSLNQLVIAAGGRIYLTKDSFTRGEDYRRMDPRVDAFLAVREKWDPGRKLRSAQSVRIFGDRA